MPAACNTSPVSNLAWIGRLELLRGLSHTVYMPPAVERELSFHPNEAAKSAIAEALRHGWIRVIPVEDSALLRTLNAQLDEGEAEAIVLAINKKADHLPIDEKEGRRAALEMGLNVTGVLGVLLAAKASGQIAAVRPEIDNLKNIAGFWVASALTDKILALAGER